MQLAFQHHIFAPVSDDDIAGLPSKVSPLPPPPQWLQLRSMSWLVQLNKGKSGSRAASSFPMPQKQGHPGKGFGAGVALVFLDVRMSLQVSPKVGAISKSTVTMGAGIGLLTWRGAKREESRIRTQISNPKASCEMTSLPIAGVSCKTIVV